MPEWKLDSNINEKPLEKNSRQHFQMTRGFRLNTYSLCWRKQELYH